MSDSKSCPLCGSINSLEAEVCVLCQSDLTEEPTVFAEAQEAVDISHCRLSPLRLGITLSLLLLAAIPWFLMCDLFRVPDDVTQARASYSRLLNRYQSKEERWIVQKDQVLESMRTPAGVPAGEELRFNDIPLEVLMAFMQEELGILPERFPDLAWYPGKDLTHPSFIFSKRERNHRSFSVMLSLEVALLSRGNRVHIEFRRLRRGSRDIAPGLVWTYFGPELQALRRLEELGGGLEEFTLNKRPGEASVASSDPVHASWHYRPHGLTLSPRRIN